MLHEFDGLPEMPGGPLVDQDDARLRGISIMMCDPETARRLSSEDPAVGRAVSRSR